MAGGGGPLASLRNVTHPSPNPPAKPSKSHRMSNTPFALQNTSSLVFGGGSGIGFASARALLIAGSAVTLAGRTKSKLENAAELLKRDVSSTGTPKVFIVTADATSEEDVKRACKTAYENGGGKLNVVVMSAGGPDPKGDVLPLFTETSLSTFEVGWEDSLGSTLGREGLREQSRPSLHANRTRPNSTSPPPSSSSNTRHLYYETLPSLSANPVFKTRQQVSSSSLL